MGLNNLSWWISLSEYQILDNGSIFLKPKYKGFKGDAVKKEWDNIFFPIPALPLAIIGGFCKVNSDVCKSFDLFQANRYEWHERLLIHLHHYHTPQMGIAFLLFVMARTSCNHSCWSYSIQGIQNMNWCRTLLVSFSGLEACNIYAIIVLFIMIKACESYEIIGTFMFTCIMHEIGTLFIMCFFLWQSLIFSIMTAMSILSILGSLSSLS